MARVTGRMMGGWTQSGWLLSMASVRLRRQIEQTLTECAELYYRSIIDCINTGGFGTWPPLTEKWASRAGSDFYHYSGHFISSIRIDFTQRGPINYSISVGVRSSDNHPSGLTLGQLADILAVDRPLFDLAWERVEPVIERKLGQIGGQVMK